MEVINSCFSICKKHGVEHYLKKNKTEQSDISDTDISHEDDDLKNGKNNVIYFY